MVKMTQWKVKWGLFIISRGWEVPAVALHGRGVDGPAGSPAAVHGGTLAICREPLIALYQAWLRVIPRAPWPAFKPTCQPW